MLGQSEEGLLPMSNPAWQRDAEGCPLFFILGSKTGTADVLVGCNIILDVRT